MRISILRNYYIERACYTIRPLGCDIRYTIHYNANVPAACMPYKSMNKAD